MITKAGKIAEDFKALRENLAKIQENPPELDASKKAGIEDEKALEAKLKSDRTKAEIVGLNQDISERKIYAEKSFRLVCRWVSGVFVLLLLQGCLSQKTILSLNRFSIAFVFKLPDSVLLAVVGGTTVSIIGIFLVVANYLFPRHNNK